MEFEMVTAVQTPLPLPDISSPSKSFENLSFIISSSTKYLTQSRKLPQHAAYQEKNGNYTKHLKLQHFANIPEDKRSWSSSSSLPLNEFL